MVRMLSWFRATPRIDAATQRYIDIVGAARNPALFEAMELPDSLDGRFEAIALHAWLVMRRLKRIPEAKPVSQRLFDILFQDMDQNLREMGASDIVVGDRVKTMAKGFYGRITAYDEGLAKGDAVLRDALTRNAYGAAPTPPSPAALAGMSSYLRNVDAALQGLSDQRMLSVEPLSWPAVPALA
ncbi:MAG: ubiquinol-cytochrome C chaperone family protein [Elsteraceae bacterium]